MTSPESIMPQRDTLKKENQARLKSHVLPNLGQREWIVLSRLKSGTILLAHPDTNQILKVNPEDIEQGKEANSEWIGVYQHNK